MKSRTGTPAGSSVLCLSVRRSQRATAGLTLIEILMTIFVLAIGLLGVAALMPVGSYQMQRGQIAQRVSEIGLQSLDLIEATEMNSPKRWLFVDGTTFDAVDPDDPADASDRTDPVRIACRITGTPSATSFPTSATGLPPRSGKGFAIDFARCQDASLYGEQWRAEDDSGTVTYLGSGTAPTPQADDVFVLRRCEPFAIDPLYMYHSNGGTGDFVPADAMPRITVSGVTSQAAAESIFQNDEDLIVVEDEDSGFPSGRAVWGPSNSNPVKAKSEGNYSWLATFSPGEKASGSDPKQWTVSVAVFFKRPLGLRDNEGKNASQWTVPFSTSGGNNGYTTVRCHGENGENDPVDATLIFDADSITDTFDQDAGDSMRIKRRQWGLVTFTYNGHKRARWYRVGTVQKPKKNDTSDLKNNIQIRLIGPDLPSGSAKITFFEGIEGVFTRAMMAEELPVGQP